MSFNETRLNARVMQRAHNVSKGRKRVKKYLLSGRV